MENLYSYFPAVVRKIRKFHPYKLNLKERAESTTNSNLTVNEFFL
jgi:hypothetical protein